MSKTKLQRFRDRCILGELRRGNYDIRQIANANHCEPGVVISVAKESRIQLGVLHKQVTPEV